MGWIITVAGAVTTYTLEIPKIKNGSAEVITKTFPAENWVEGDLVIYHSKTASGITWSRVSGASAQTGGYRVSVASGSGTPTATVLPRLTAILPASLTYLGAPDSRQPSQAVKVLKPAETWVSQQRIYQKNTTTGVAYTNSVTSANSAGLYRAAFAMAEHADPDDASYWWVMPIWQTGVSTYQPLAYPATPIGLAINIGQPIFSDLLKTSWANVASATRPIYRGQISALFGTGGSTAATIDDSPGTPRPSVSQIALQRAASQSMVGPAQAAFGAAIPLIDDLNYVSLFWITSDPSVAGYTSLVVRLPNLAGTTNGTLDDFSYDVTLPSPVGSCRVVWCAGVPFLCRRTTSTAPESWMSRTNRLRDSHSIQSDRDLPSSTFVRIDQHQAQPYGLRAWSCGGNNGHQNIVYTGSGREQVPQENVFAMPVLSGASSAYVTVHAAWYYWDPNLNNFVLGGTETAMTQVPATTRWYGTIAAPTIPTGMNQSCWTIGTRAALVALPTGPYDMDYYNVADTNQSLYVGRCLIQYSSLHLPAYPWDVPGYSWMPSDSDLTVSSNIGWIDPDRLTLTAPTWDIFSISVTPTSGNLAVQVAATVVSGNPGVMASLWTARESYLRLVCPSLGLTFDSSTNSWHILKPAATKTKIVSGPGVVNVSVRTPSSAPIIAQWEITVIARPNRSTSLYPATGSGSFPQAAKVFSGTVTLT